MNPVGLESATRSPVLAAFDQRKARTIELRYFAGLSSEETPETLGVSLATGRETPYA